MAESIFCFVPNTPTNLCQLSKPGTVLESGCLEDSKTVPESWIWQRFGWDNQGKKQLIGFQKNACY